MKRKRFSKEQIIAILKEGEAGISLPNLCRKYGMGRKHLLCLEIKICWHSVPALKRLKELEEDARLKRMYAELNIDQELLKEVLEKS